MARRGVCQNCGRVFYYEQKTNIRMYCDDAKCYADRRKDIMRKSYKRRKRTNGNEWRVGSCVECGARVMTREKNPLCETHKLAKWITKYPKEKVAV